MLNKIISGAVIVTTPQKVALADARKAVKMFEKVDIPLLGIVENMSSFVCPKCQEITHVFGENQRLFEDYESLGSIPLEVEIMKNADEGTPIVVQNPDSKSSQNYLEIAGKILKRLL